MFEVDHGDLDRVKEALETWLRDKLPECEHLHLPPLAASQGGGSSQTIFVSPVIRDAGVERQEHWVLRVQATGHQIYQDPSVEKQFLVMKKLAEAGTVPVPAVLWYEADDAILGAPFFIMEKVAGRVPDAFYHSEGLLAEASPAQRETLWLSAVEALAGIHRVDPGKFAFLARPQLGGSGLEQEIAIWDSYRTWCGVPIKAIQDRARHWLRDNPPTAWPTGLAWGDARLPNMVFADGRCKAVIDWETASLGGAETDLGWWLFFDWYIAEGMGKSRLPGIPAGETFIATWESFAGRQARDMLWHEVFATWRFSMISARARLLAGYPQTPQDSDPIAQRLAHLIG